ncbi:sensor histidine kinase [Rhodobacteraceae bacterium HSP-20]|jgi:two-component system sensor histidine kinase ChvG|uniref:histidine kinase n=1 Tax=Paragemmobacter amnigenus TaxID=2852097 RepID=A0ABS6J1C2_9RHOB|nr:sensor N-terminal transmembrane domain-containing protein [Rhodobacter amnigenus]MBU9697202.1 sensor histidine kinase [Rhodobacter amnigenus]MBV4388429.1 sensor histidine kinase [Rhodobacter amnigenus]
MTAAPRIGKEARPARPGDVVLGEDWTSAEGLVDPALRASRDRRGFVSLNRSPLARKIMMFNLLALLVLAGGVLFLNPFRDSLLTMRNEALVVQTQLVADMFEAVAVEDGAALDAARMARLLETAPVGTGVTAYAISPTGEVLAEKTGAPLAEGAAPRATPIVDTLSALWNGVAGLFLGGAGDGDADRFILVKTLLPAATKGEGVQISGRGPDGGLLFAVAEPVTVNGTVVGVVAVLGDQAGIDALARGEREQVLMVFIVSLMISFGLSLVLASTIANPLSDLAAAAELGRDRDARKMAPGRVRIPDLAARPDEIGRLSVAMRGMVAALYDRIDANEQFAADVAHEIKNPLASLRSAVGTMRLAKREDQKEKLLEVIEHDVRRLDRLVSDISNASRLDSELVREEEEEFNLIRTLANLTEYLGQQAREKGVEFITDFPADPVLIRGLEARLAQVFVNLITNAISFCEDGDAVRVWARRRENRVLIVVEDTGPGIPEQALTKVFKRFYSERPQGQFGEHSGLGLAISKQIVEAHGGVIWAENIRPTHADVNSDPLGARFVVGLPV